MKTPEGKVKDAVKAYLKSIGAYFFMPVQNGYGASTIDFLVCVDGKFLGIETKAPKDTPAEPTERQGLVLAAIREAGGAAICISRVEELRLFLLACGWRVNA